MNAQTRSVGEGTGVFIGMISGGDQEEVTSREYGRRGALESPLRRRHSGDRVKEWDGGGKLIRRELQMGQSSI